jgi:hypothetical protein
MADITISAVAAVASGKGRTGTADITVAPLPATAGGRVDTTVVSVIVLAPVAVARGVAPAPTVSESSATTITPPAAVARGVTRTGSATITVAPTPAHAAGRADPPTPAVSVFSGFPDVTVEIAFADGPLTVAPTWTDVTADCREITISRGRNDELARFDTGTANVRLDNSQRQYDPTNVAGPHYPNVLPMRQLRVRAHEFGQTYDLFRGFIEEWPPTRLSLNGAEVNLECTDAFAWLANIKITEPLYTEDTAGQRVLDVLADISWSAFLYSARSIADQAVVAEIDEPDGELEVLTGLQDATDSELGDLYVDGAGIITFRDRRQKLEIPDTPVATFGNDLAGGELPFIGDLRPSYGISTVTNHAVVSLPDWDPSEDEDLTSQGTYGIRSRSYDTQLADPVDADTIASVLIWRGKNPRLRYEALAVKPARLPSLVDPDQLWKTVLAAEIGVYWTVVDRPAGGGDPNEQDSFVQGLVHHIGPGRAWESSFTVAKPDPHTTFFKIEDTTYGKIQGPGSISY